MRLLLSCLETMLTVLKGLLGRGAKADNGTLQPGIRLATVNEWWRLTRDYPSFRTNVNAPLKHFGYMAIVELLQRYKPQRILEFGHGFNSTLFRAFQDHCEVWGVDDFCALPYFPDKDDWEQKYDKHIVQKCPKVRLVRGLLGQTAPGVIPENYFDAICSVSVLEELKRSDVERILGHAHRLLRPGGFIVNSFDWHLPRRKHYSDFVQAHWNSGFDPGVRTLRPPRFDIHELLLENSIAVMVNYQGQDPEERKYRGHWGTMVVCATRKCDAHSATSPTVG